MSTHRDVNFSRDAVIVYNGLNERRTDGGTEGDSGEDEGGFVSSSVS